MSISTGSLDFTSLLEEVMEERIINNNKYDLKPQIIKFKIF